MRRLSGTYDGVEHLVLEYVDGQVECSSDLRPLLCDAQGEVLTGEALDDAMRVLCGESLVIREI